MINPWWFTRMARMFRNPPSAKTIILWVSVIGFCLLLVLFEQVFGWPEWLRFNDWRPRRFGVQPLE